MEFTSKKFFGFTFVLLTVLFAVSFASATINLTTITGLPSIVNDSSSYAVTLNVTNSGNESVNISWSGIVTPTVVTISTLANTILLSNQSTQVSFTYSIPTGLTGAVSSTIYASGNNSQSANNSLSTTAQITPVASSFCDFGVIGSNISVNLNINNNGEGEDEEWYLLDDVEIEVEVSNNNPDKKISDIEVNLVIFLGTDDVTDDFDLQDDKISLGSINDDDEETATFVIDNVPADISEGAYTLKVKAYPKGDEDLVCDEETSSIDITNPFGEGVIVYGGAINLVTEVRAGDTIDEISFDAINLGFDKEDEVLVTIFNQELGINERYNINDLRDGDTEAVYFPAIKVPTSATAKTYKVEVQTFFDYDDGEVLDESSYDQNSQDDLEGDYNAFAFYIRVIGGTVPDTSEEPTVSAKLKSEAQVNTNLVIELTLTNNGNQTTSFLITPESYSSWAELVSVEPPILSLTKQETGKVVLTLKPTAEGQKTFNLKVNYNGESIDQPVTVNVAKAGSGFLNRLFAQFGKTTTYLLMGIVILVILIIIILIVRAFTSKKSDD